MGKAEIMQNKLICIGQKNLLAAMPNGKPECNGVQVRATIGVSPEFKQAHLMSSIEVKL